MKIIHNNETITGENIYSCEISEYCDLISNEIASNTLTVKLKVPVEKVFKKKDQIVCVDNNDNIMGYFYIETAKLVDYISYDNSYVYDINANDIVYYLEDYDFLGAYYTEIDLESVLTSMFRNTGITLIIPASLKEYKISGYCPAGNLREALQSLCFTNNLIVNTSRINGIELRIEDDITKNVIEYEKIFGTDIDVNDELTGVSATATSYLYPKSDSDRNTLFEGVFTDYDLGETIQTITFEPHQYFLIENGTILDATTCFAAIQANNGTDTVKLTGIPYVKTQISYTKGDKKNSVVINNNTMINIYNINNLISNVYDYYSNTHTANIDCLYAGNVPGDRIAVKTKFGLVYGRISEQTISITNATQRVKMTVEGALLPPQESYYTPNELRTGDKLGII